MFKRIRSRLTLPTQTPVLAVVFSCLPEPHRENNPSQAQLMVHVIQDGVGNFVPERVTDLDVAVIPR